MPEQPDNPEPAFPSVDSMLSRKFGKEIANYFSGNPLNRVGFLREDSKFLSSAFAHPSTSFLVCNELQPLIKKGYKVGSKLEFVGKDSIVAVVGEDPYAKGEKDQIADYDSSVYTPQMIFLGIDEANKNGMEYQSKNLYKGAPYFAVDITPRHPSVKDACEKLIAELGGKGMTFAQGRVMDVDATHGKNPAVKSKYKYSSSFLRRERIENSEAWYADASEAAIYAEARALLDWNARNPFCGACGNPTMSANGGFKRVCPPRDKQKEGDRPSCITRTRISNLSFPRTDPTVIMAIVNSANTHLLLGRQKVWPPYWYSTLAGFAEPAESIEEAVRREVYEEAGIIVGRVVIHSTQPWPYPANLMIGAIGQAVPASEVPTNGTQDSRSKKPSGGGVEGEQEIDLGNDPELGDARWVPFEEVRHALRVGTSGLGEDAGPEYKEGGLRLPPNTAIANQLMTAVTSGFVGGTARI